MTRSAAPAQPNPMATDPMIQLSVHSLPAADQAQTQRTRVGRIKMLLVWAVCAAPVVASYFMYYVVRPEGRTNHGALIQPVRAMPESAALPLLNLQGSPVLPASLKGQWLLVSVAGGACEAACEKTLYLQRQLRESLGRDKDRVDRVWLVSDGAPVREALLPALQQATVLRAPQADLARWLEPEAGRQLADHLYLVDPRGDWMMRFPANVDFTKAKRDLTRLLKASEAWDEAGRQ
ncbi:SCO family protein [Aquabacterium parvum]|uniref:SCO family protein n=1 Tax=Aquabacterium parvum TaxID=70584 RepID=UPI001F174412|nr:hypothetical protein [Aquabacterium parvum]